MLEPRDVLGPRRSSHNALFYWNSSSHRLVASFALIGFGVVPPQPSRFAGSQSRTTRAGGFGRVETPARIKFQPSTTMWF
jgi:hypothetical protein